MIVVPPLTGTEAITPAYMNALFASLDAGMNTLLNGRSPLLAFPGTYPPVLFGKCFYFTSGRTAYAQRCPFAPVFTTTAVDPISLGTGNVNGVRTYDTTHHNFFINAAASAVIASYDTDNPRKYIAVIGEIGQGAYPPGLTLKPGVSLFEHSLEAHTKTAKGPGDSVAKKYFLKETNPGNAFRGGHWPTKRYDRALAEMIVEGPSSVTIPARYDKFSCFRWHNLQDRTLTVTYQNAVGANFVFTIPPFGCRTVRRTWNGTTQSYENYRHGQFKYFFTFENSDPREFWFFGSGDSMPGFFARPSITDQPFDSSDGAQGSNLSCPTILYEWIRALTVQTNHAYFVRDPHVVMDMTPVLPELAAKFGNPALDTTRIGDLIHHKGKFCIVRRSKTIFDDITVENPTGVPRTVFEEGVFNGYETIVSDFAAYQIQVTTDGQGNLRLRNIDPANNVDLVPYGTNFLKDHGDDGQDAVDFVVPTAVNIDTPRTIEYRIFESTGVAHQDADGTAGFNLRAASNYRVTQKEVASKVNVRAHQGPGPYPTPHTYTTGDDWQTLEEIPVNPSGLAMQGIHNWRLSDLKSLKFNGNSLLTSQDTAFSTYHNQAFKFTPEGFVMTFDERVAPEVLPVLSVGPYNLNQVTSGTRLNWNAVTGYLVATIAGSQPFTGRFTGIGCIIGFNATNAQTGAPIDPVYLELVHSIPHPAPNAGFLFYSLLLFESAGNTNFHSQLSSTGWIYDGALDRWTRKHCLRFRKHGWGFGQLGKHFAAHFSPVRGRLLIRGWDNEISGIGGADYSYPVQNENETDVRVLRRLSTSELSTTVVPGARFFVSNTLDTIDGLIPFLANKTQNWYHTNRGALIGGFVVRNTPYNVRVGMALCAEHYNAMAQAVNQLTTGKLLSWKAIRIVHGNKCLDFSTLLKWDEPSSETGSVTVFSRYAPAPIDCFIPITALIQTDPGPGFGEDISQYWVHWFGTKGIYVASPAADLPASVAAFRIKDNFTRNCSTTATIRITNATFAQFFQVQDVAPFNNGTYWWSSYNADVTASMSLWQFAGSQVATFNERGNVFIQKDKISLDYRDGITTEGRLLKINLNTCYPSTLRWLRYQDFDALCLAMGLYANEMDVGIPVVLDVVKINPQFEPNAFTPSSILLNTHIGGREITNGAQPAPSHFRVVDDLNRFNGPPLTGVNIFVNTLTNTFGTERLVFRIAATEAEAASGFKVPAFFRYDTGNAAHITLPKTAPLEAYQLANRTEGRIRISSTRIEGWAYGHNSYGLTTAGQPQNGGPNVPPGSPTPPLQPPFTSTAFDYDRPQPNQLAQWGGSSVFSTGNSYLAQRSARVVYSNPIRLSGDIAIPSDGALLAAQEHYAAFLNYEHLWYFARAIQSAGVTASAKFYMFPQGHWEKALNWWLQDDAHYDQSQYGFSIGNPAQNQDHIPFAGLSGMIDREVAPPRWVPVSPTTFRRTVEVSAGQAVTSYPPVIGAPPTTTPLVAGYALLKPNRGEMVKIIYDPVILTAL